jgi:ABC-type glutathione transport system ATPase component
LSWPPAFHAKHAASRGFMRQVFTSRRTVGNHVVMATAAMRISALRKEYPGRGGHHPVVAVDGIDVEIAVGEIVAFLGPNGAGKTTTLDIALGLVPRRARSRCWAPRLAAPWSPGRCRPSCRPVACCAT